MHILTPSFTVALTTYNDKNWVMGCLGTFVELVGCADHYWSLSCVNIFLAGFKFLGLKALSSHCLLAELGFFFVVMVSFLMFLPSTDHDEK